MPESVDLGFKVEPAKSGEGLDFEVRGAGIGGGAWFGIGLLGFIFGILASLWNLNGFTPLIVVFALSMLVAFLMDAARKESYRFHISPNFFQVRGKEYSKSNVSEILIQNRAGQTATSVNIRGGSVVFGTGVVGVAYVGATMLSNAASSIGRGAGDAIRDSLAKRGNSVCIRHGRKVVELAGNLTEDDAVALFNFIVVNARGNSADIVLPSSEKNEGKPPVPTKAFSGRNI
jgi:hypothetical protein